MEIGFIGLGHLGRAVAERLLECGHRLFVWNRSLQKTEGLQAEVMRSAKEVAEKVDIIFICLFDSEAVSEVLSSDNGVLQADVSNKVIIDLTSNHYNAVINFYDTCRSANAHYLESPVLGSVVPARNGALTILTSGNEQAYKKVKPVLEHIGENLFYLEKPQLAAKIKLINNLALGNIMITLAETVGMAEKVGLDKKDVLDILCVGGGNSLVLNAKKQKLLEEDYTTHFSNALIYKDLNFLQDMAFEMKTPLFTAALAKEIFARTFEEGFEQEDFCAVYKLFQKSDGGKKTED